MLLYCTDSTGRTPDNIMQGRKVRKARMRRKKLSGDEKEEDIIFIGIKPLFWLDAETLFELKQTAQCTSSARQM